ncbi:MAG TPA: magnesium transporter [Elusimicrobia bacterium]|nr:magnesium transporter [Elusimicrobiota bacterium]
MKKIEAALAMIRHLIRTEPARAAEALETLEQADSARILELLPEADSAALLERHPPQKAAHLLARLPAQRSASLAQALSPRQAAAVLGRLPEKTARRIIALLPKELAAAMGETLSYPAQSAGRLMHGDFLSFRAGLRVEEVIHRLRQLARGQVPLSYCYVVDGNSRLIGVLNMRDLLLADGEARIESVMITKVLHVSPFADREELVTLFSKKHFLTMPVIDTDGRLLGVVPTSNIIESTEEEAGEDIQILFGASAEERAFSTVWFKITRRLPWLTINLFTVFLAGAVVAVFEDLIARAAVLAVFLPIIAGQGGNAGTQTLAVVIRGMLMREVSPQNAWRLVKTEVLAGLVNGFATGALTALAAWLWKGSPFIGVIAGFAMVVTMVAAGLSGALIPLTMKRFGYDPAHSSGIFVTTVTDVTGFFSFLGLAWLFRAWL